MKVAYLINQYPKVSHTFIRREIYGLERAGTKVSRYTVRRSADPLLDPEDAAEAERTRVILDVGLGGLLGAVVSTALTRSLAFLRALRLSLRIGWRSERGLLRNLVYLAQACVLRQWLATEGIRHLHAHFGTNSAAVAMLCHELGGPTYSFTVHGPDEFDLAPLISLREKIERAAFVVAISHFGRSQLFRHCGHTHWHKVIVARCGVDQTFLESPLTPVPDTDRLVSVGRLSEQKGQLLLIEALGILARRGRAFHLTLVGDGELRAEVEAAIKAQGLENRVTITGWADGSQVRHHILGSRAMILPSFAEGLPVVLMEALALGRPVVTTYVAGIPELVCPEVNGWLVPAGAVEPLVEALEEVLSTPLNRLTTMGLDGHERVSAQHSMASIAPVLQAAFQPWG